MAREPPLAPAGRYALRRRRILIGRLTSEDVANPCAPYDPGPGTTKEVLMARSLTSTLYRLARASATGRAVRTGHAGRRAKNILIGRSLGRCGVWRRLWK